MSRTIRAVANTVLAIGAVAAMVAAAERPVRAHDAKSFSAGEPGNPKRASRVIELTMTEEDGRMLFKPRRIVVNRGEQIRFVLTNVGVLDHEFMIATPSENKKHAALMQKFPDMEHDDANGKTVKTKQKGELVWRFTKTGEFEFACLIPGHYESGMFGRVVVR